MVTFTSSLPEDIIDSLNEKSKKLNMPKNKIIEKALRIFLEHIEKVEYIQSFKKAGNDHDLMLIAEEGMADYLKQLESK